MSLERMTGIEEVDLGAATLTALAGTPLQVIQKAAEEAGFLCGIDLGARGQLHDRRQYRDECRRQSGLRYGMAREQRARARGRAGRRNDRALAQQDAEEQCRLRLDADVHRLEGTLGVVTRVVLGLHARPEGVSDSPMRVKSVEDALLTLRAFEKHFAGGLLVFEGMWQEFMQVATGPIGMPAPFAAEHEILLLVEAAAGRGTGRTGRFENCLAELHEAGFVQDAVIAQSGQDRARLWAYRESPYEYDRLFPKQIGFDVSIPRSHLGEAMTCFRADIASRWPEAIQVYFGHIADSNLHVIVTMPHLDGRRNARSKRRSMPASPPSAAPSPPSMASVATRDHTCT